MNLSKKVKYVEIDVPVNYGEEDIPEDFPFRYETDKGWTYFKILVKHPEGIIIDFPNNYELKEEWLKQNKSKDSIDDYIKENRLFIYMKVVDGGIYKLYDKNKELIAEKDGYVPDENSIPGEYGDYLELDINLKTGEINNWKEEASFEDMKSYISMDYLDKEKKKDKVIRKKLKVKVKDLNIENENEKNINFGF